MACAIVVSIASGCSKTPASAGSRQPLRVGTTTLDLAAGEYTIWWEFPCGHLVATEKSFTFSVTRADIEPRRHPVTGPRPDADGCMWSLQDLDVSEPGLVRIEIEQVEPDVGRGALALHRR